MSNVTSKKRPYSKNGRLYLGDTDDTTQQWSVADPTDAETEEAMWRLRYTPRNQNNTVVVKSDDVFRVLAMAEAWSHFATYELGVTRAIVKLRETRRALRALRKP